MENQHQNAFFYSALMTTIKRYSVFSLFSLLSSRLSSTESIHRYYFFVLLTLGHFLSLSVSPPSPLSNFTTFTSFLSFSQRYIHPCPRPRHASPGDHHSTSFPAMPDNTMSRQVMLLGDICLCWGVSFSLNSPTPAASVSRQALAKHLPLCKQTHVRLSSLILFWVPSPRRGKICFRRSRVAPSPLG